MVGSQMLKLRGFYLFIGLAGGMFNPYLTLLLVQNGLTSTSVGALMAIGTLVSILVQPVWGIIVDQYRQMRLVLILSVAVPGIMAVCYQSEHFVLMALVYSIMAIFTATQAPIADSYAIVTAKKAGATYGSIRFMASIGNAVGGYAGGLFVSLLSVSMIWVPFLVLNSLAALTALALPKNTEEDLALRKSFSDGIGQLIRNRTFLIFLGGSFLVNQTLTAFNTYFVLAFKMSGGPTELVGVALLVASITNVPSMLLASRVIRRIGLERTLLLGAVAYMLRWGVQLAFPDPAVMIAVQVLHGLSFGFFYIAAVEYVSHVTEKDMQATGQSVFNMVFAGLAGIVGNLLNGYLLHAGGPQLMNLACLISATLGALMMVYVSRSRKDGKTEKVRKLSMSLPSETSPQK
ncbi:MFS transporter [Paenibacillus terrae]